MEKRLEDLFEAIADGATYESSVWGDALLSNPERQPEAVFSRLVPEELGVGLETVYEAYLVHYGRSRLFAAPDHDEAVLLGDYLYAHGLVRIAEAGGVEAVRVLADLISRCAALRADGRAGDGAAWVDAARALGGAPDDGAIARALALHSARVAA